jgi:hypothetical protein
MSALGRRIRNARGAEIDRAAGSSRAETPYWLLWSVGGVAFVLAVAAFVLWGVFGAGTLLDMIVALCM